MSIFYLASSIATSAVRLSGLLIVSLGQLSFYGVFFLADFSLSTEDGVEQRTERSLVSRATDDPV